MHLFNSYEYNHLYNKKYGCTFKINRTKKIKKYYNPKFLINFSY